MNRLDLYERYVTAWSSLSAVERMTVLADTVSQDVNYRDANTRRRGLAALGEFLMRISGTSAGLQLPHNLAADLGERRLGKVAVRR